MYNQMIDSSAFCGANRHVVGGQPCRRTRVSSMEARFSPDKHVILTSLTEGVCSHARRDALCTEGSMH